MAKKKKAPVVQRGYQTTSLPKKIIVEEAPALEPVVECFQEEQPSENPIQEVLANSLFNPKNKVKVAKTDVLPKNNYWLDCSMSQEQEDFLHGYLTSDPIPKENSISLGLDELEIMFLKHRNLGFTQASLTVNNTDPGQTSNYRIRDTRIPGNTYTDMSQMALGESAAFMACQ
jgi:hypothetical protein